MKNESMSKNNSKSTPSTPSTPGVHLSPSCSPSKTSPVKFEPVFEASGWNVDYTEKDWDIKIDVFWTFSAKQ